MQFRGLKLYYCIYRHVLLPYIPFCNLFSLKMSYIFYNGFLITLTPYIAILNGSNMLPIDP